MNTKILFFTFVLITTPTVFADSLPIGCAVRTYDCFPYPDGTTKCVWGTDLGKLYSLNLQKSGSGPNYEIWEGKITGLVRGKYPFVSSVYQRRESKRKVNYITTELTISGAKISAVGQEVAEVKHLVETTNKGIGLHCSVDINPSIGIP